MDIRPDNLAEKKRRAQVAFRDSNVKAYIAKKTSRNNSPLQKFDAHRHRNFHRMAGGLQLAGVLIDVKGEDVTAPEQPRATGDAKSPSASPRGI